MESDHGLFLANSYCTCNYCQEFKECVVCKTAHKYETRPGARRDGSCITRGYYNKHLLHLFLEKFQSPFLWGTWYKTLGINISIKISICDMIKRNESLVEDFQFFEFSTPQSGNFKMLHFDANPIRMSGYKVMSNLSVLKTI